eukprot:TRINITY_DN3678_c0_g4_i1.p1 TRINITY_DN3678_c0_g4~~TRINITY_DN3678_c0_g4_i1.p1  ORF type:complete len:535 (-),score=146.30 TRINITY_DN3678_c0_g4_i1:59-1663(-)
MASPLSFNNKGTAFSHEEREKLGLTGLLPPIVETLDQQAERALAQFRRLSTTIDQYNFLTTIRYTNEVLFYHLLINNLVEMVPIVYTPTVGQACREWSQHYRWPEGMYITRNEKGKIRSVLDNWKKDVSIIVVTDGSRILGLGDLGAGGLGIPVGKLQLYVAGAGFNPENTLPIVLDTGTNTTRYHESPFYVGVKENRLADDEYYPLVEEFLVAVKDKWPNALLQFEDFSNNHCFDLLEKYAERLRCFNDDIQGTGAVIASGFINAAQLSGVPYSQQRIVFLGAGSAGIGVADEIVEVMIASDPTLTKEDARKRFYFVDSAGLVTTKRGGSPLQAHKVPYARDDYEKITTLIEIINTVKPTALVGLSGIGKAFTPEILKAVSALNERPIIFSLSNPTSNSECSAEDAYLASEGRAIFASGSPYDPVTIGERTLVPGQGNNMYIFPGLGFGSWLCQATKVSGAMVTASAMTLASLVTPENLSLGNIYPDLTRIREISVDIATAVIEQAFKENLANIEKPADIKAFVKENMWKPHY